MRKIGIDEIARHASADDLWVVVDGAVYDLTEFAPRHPGGTAVLQQYAGRDASRPYGAVHAPSLIGASLEASQHLGVVDEDSVTPQWRSATVSADVDEGPGRQGRGGAAASQKPPLDSVINLQDFEDIARAVLPPQAWAYISTGSNDNVSRDANAAFLRRIWLRPAVLLRDVSTVRTAATLFGGSVSLHMPVYVAPTGATRTGGPEGELAIARGAAAAGIIPVISTVASFPYEEILAALPDGAPAFFQLYVDRDRSRTTALLRSLLHSHRGRAAIRAVFVTVDVPVVSKREADERERARASRACGEPVSPGGIAKQAGSFVDSAFVWEDLRWLRDVIDEATATPAADNTSHLPIIVKGIQRASDALIALAMGCQGIVLSNHGGRAADGAPPAILTLLELHRCCPEIFGRMDIFVDGGFRRGSDVVKAICLGASAVGFGRPFVYSVGYGYAGVRHAAAIIQDEVRTAMQLCGMSDLMRDAHPGFVNTAEIDHIVPIHNDHPYAKKPSIPSRL
ncbi:mitochondrial fmn-dependent dehydrogenase [Grosmannia clavigera kw1407]|uniref:Mitochondrial fmn-dependent dehydrogenase n=1 Tax=Grosmannia clavigera (strain kw1407 / UAMH 11150) TaxID=655863 RepID=F0XV66_GROCL|nr:mitochondrial fmn-dependent dehydrogenase [Grosmannia clavigera kw1407]EFW98769.1 mitochondrial fmn-dependent dehydrogenase [Grosmannia clavigera kw1407]